MTVRRSTLRDNAGGYGGGVYDNGSLRVIDSTFVGNSSGEGGGVFSTNTEIVNSTFSGNIASNVGGGIGSGWGSTTRVYNSTFTLNQGHGIFVRGAASLTSTVVANNGPGNDVYNEGLLNATASLIESGIPGGINGTNMNNILGVDPLLGPLADNGGPTMTHAISAGSPAIDAGRNPHALATDQRGESRIQGRGADIGALESAFTTLDPSHVIVDTLVDENDGDYSIGDLSLREALALTRTNPGSDLIEFDPNLFAGGPRILSLNGSALPVNSSVEVRGPGAGLLTIDAHHASQVLRVDDGDNSVVSQITINGVTITGGQGEHGGGIYNIEVLRLNQSAVHDNDAAWGAGIYSRGHVHLNGAQVTANSASIRGGGLWLASGTNHTLTASNIDDNTADLGGGIYNDFAVLVMTDSTLTGNMAANQGGGMYNSGETTLTRAMVDANHAVNGGAGIFNVFTLSVNDSTFSDNTATAHGAGIYNASRLTVQDSTFSGNSAAWSGGGIYSASHSGELTVVGSTFSANIAEFGGGLFKGDNGSLVVTNTTISGNSVRHAGGGIYNAIGAYTLNNSTVTLNRANSEGSQTHAEFFGGGIFNAGGAPSIASTIVAENFVGTGMDSDDITGTAVNATSSLIGGDALLGPLADNGGPTLTHAILPGSPAIDAGSNPNALTTDQRGQVRTYGFGTDIGAYESPFVAPVLVVDTLADEDDGNHSAGDRSLREVINAANADPDVQTITFADGLTGTIVLTLGQLNIANPMTLTGPGADVLTVSGNNASRVFNVDNGTASQIDVTLTDLTIADGASPYGGGIFNQERLTVAKTTLRDNAGGYAGGIYDAASLLVLDSTFVGNSSGVGGGIYTTGNTQVINSTFSANIASNVGGGIASASEGTVSVSNSTFTSNQGHGIFVRGRVTLTSTIVANSGPGNDVYNEGLLNVTASLIEGGIPGGINGTNVNNILGVDPLLGPLVDNGGPTMSHALLAGSPAIGSGSNPLGLATDQRGEARTIGSGTDIGAYESPFTNTPPEFTSPDSASIPENSRAVLALSASDGDVPAQAVSFSIAGSGADDALFQIVNGNVLEFITAPDFETPLDADADNVYEVQVRADDGHGGAATQSIRVTVLNQASITGTVFMDTDQDGLFDANEPGIDDVTVDLLDMAGAVVATTTTSDGGFYLFEDQNPGTFRIHERQPTGMVDGADLLGSLGGMIVANDTMELNLARIDAQDYHFAELGQAALDQRISSGDTATIGFWQNKHGQALITAGGTNLAQWLSYHFGNVFGDALIGASGAEVASFYRDQVFKQKAAYSAGPKVDAQFMAVALAVFFTNSNLAGTVAAGYGFNVTETGIGMTTFNVGDNGAAFGVADNTSLTIMELLLATNSFTDQPDDRSGFASVYDRNGDGVIDAEEAALRAKANRIYTLINEQGKI